MHVARLELSGFRSYAALKAEFPAGPQVVVGQNAAGKTNLIEALVVLATGRSHRTSSDAELINWHADICRLETRAADSTLEVVLTRPGSPAGRKRVRVNGVPRRGSSGR